MANNFLDSNILLYLASNDASKSARAEALVSAGGNISVQVLNEIASVARRKFGMDWAQLRSFMEPFPHLLTVHEVTLATHQRGFALAERHRFAIHDAMIVAAALLAGCATLWSEDMHHGLLVEGTLTIRNPFA